MFGVSVLAFVAGNAGGITRDVLIGAVPPAAISNWRYVAASLIAGVATFIWYPSVTRLQRIVLLLDAAGLATFAVAGTQKALAYNVSPVAAALLGMLTGIGGGIMRDVLVKEIPVVLPEVRAGSGIVILEIAQRRRAIALRGHARQSRASGSSPGRQALPYGRYQLIRRDGLLENAGYVKVLKVLGGGFSFHHDDTAPCSRCETGIPELNERL